MGKHALTRRPAPESPAQPEPRKPRPVLPIAALALTGVCTLGAAGLSVAGPPPAGDPAPAHGVPARAAANRAAEPRTEAGRAAATAAPTPTPGRGEDRASRDLARTPLAQGVARHSPSASSRQEHGDVVSTGTCEASYYDTGSVTANGEPYDTSGLTAASKTLPFGTKVRVTARETGRSVVVRINDRGPYVSGRCLDLTPAAFQQVADQGAGVVDVRYEVLAKD